MFQRMEIPIEVTMNNYAKRFIFKLIVSALIFIAIVAISSESRAGTCSSISRTNFSANSILTSTDLNSQFNTVYNQVNALDGGCITDGTLELAAINTSEWEVVLDAIKEGCKVSYSDSNTVSVGRCYASVNGNFVSTTSANTATWGCTGCSSESADTQYYVYIKDGGSGTTLDPIITTTAPNENGYDGSNNRILGRFFNNASSDIDQYSIDQWVGNRFHPTNTSLTSYTPTTQGFGTISGNNSYFLRMGSMIFLSLEFTSGTVTGSTAQIHLPTGLNVASGAIDAVCGFVTRAGGSNLHPVYSSGNNYITVHSPSNGTSSPVTGSGGFNNSQAITVYAWVPVEEWNE